ncbi:unnamed protein product [Thelazia callipaeda]|uniref:Chemokine vCXCL1 n=1 Tax=Thelazia callipaeda TaxID=103827 RepID=A0A0N5DBN4_THECL|nr:unnamed protein product [Thelazia callipaeda]
MWLLVAMYTLYAAVMVHTGGELRLDCNKTYSLPDDIGSIIWPDICHNINSTVQS